MSVAVTAVLALAARSADGAEREGPGLPSPDGAGSATATSGPSPLTDEPRLDVEDPGELLDGVQLAPGSQCVGAILLDVPESSGTVIYRPGATQGGWEWTF